jgi:hypothetical protein
MSRNKLTAQRLLEHLYTNDGDISAVLSKTGVFMFLKFNPPLNPGFSGIALDDIIIINAG